MRIWIRGGGYEGGVVGELRLAMPGTEPIPEPTQPPEYLPERDVPEPQPAPEPETPPEPDTLPEEPDISGLRLGETGAWSAS